MASTRSRAVLMFTCSLILILPSVCPASQVTGVLYGIAGRLRQAQDGLSGNWQIGFNGSIVVGMIRAYEYTGNGADLDAARRGGKAILAHASHGIYGDDAYALANLSQHAGNPADNTWRMVLDEFYQQVQTEPGGTAGYINQHRAIDSSTAVFYIAHHTVAAFYVDAEDKGIWRTMLIASLSRVSDSSSHYPVMALGVALWALAQTGPLDSTPIPMGEGSSSMWAGKTLADLPALLLGHQVPEGQKNAGSFYWRFDHGDAGSGAPVSGYTEDTVFSVLGLLAASYTDPEIRVDSAITAARGVLLNAADAQGRVYVSLDGSGLEHPAFAAELLRVLPTLDPIWAMGSWIVSGQAKDGERAGGWPGEEEFTGTLLTGLLCATRQFWYNVPFEQAVSLAGRLVLSQSNFWGDEAYALTQLSASAANPSNNPFRSAVKAFYRDVKMGEGGTAEYVRDYAQVEKSAAVFCLAHHVLAAHYVGADDKNLWKDTLIRTLSQVDDSAEYPVMALGVAIWALAQVGPLDQTPIGGEIDCIWAGKVLADLPAMLLSHQVPEGQDNAGSFYRRFDHQENGAMTSGYTEDAVFGLLGLRVALRASGGGQYISLRPFLESAVVAAQSAIAEGIGGSGRLYEHLSGNGALHRTYAAKVLMAIAQ